MRIKSKIIEFYCSDTEKAPEEINKGLEGIEDYQIVAITESKPGLFQYHYTVFYKSDDDHMVLEKTTQMTGGYIVSPSKNVIWEKEGRLDGI